ncbi:hypothetical protein G7076_08435 [Sphingomonas sp. HDW15A]|uniref:hypothetical protein n=1 Tax=Sphingomonas sp. HDW15A TaxID=2714942 RepID=UPI00140D96DC|nr:hypothetical protein [Sphingomonas sp. HDW15A]QIK96463.1 hypothetical protein G7076_08435 [Sphingomonas sp. HDW15A]
MSRPGARHDLPALHRRAGGIPHGGSCPDPAKPLFASDEPLRLTISGGVDQIAKGGPNSREGRPGTLAIAGSADSLPILLEPRGITRRQRDVCQFPPLRVTFNQPPPADSVFAGQRRLKLVSHCRAAENFQNYLLLEYAAYRLYNNLTPLSFRARLAQIEYRDSAGQPITTRYGFFIEDIDDVAKRNGMTEARMGERFPVSRLSPTDAARFAIFQYMISNLDWAMQAGPPGDSCCHNSRPIAPAGASSPQVIPVPYDFDFSGMVNAPYATPPSAVNVSNVRQRRYRGLCRHNAEARALYPQFRAQQAAVPQILSSVPGLDPTARDRAIGFLGGFFSDIATDQQADKRMLGTCLG